MRATGFLVLPFACVAMPVFAQSAAAGAAARSAGVLERTRLDPTRDLAFEAAVVPETVYVGQQATYEVGVFLSDEIRARLRRNPEFVPPEVRSMLAFDVPWPEGSASRTAGGRHYDVHVFQRALFPLTAGSQVIPSAHLNYALPLSNSFFAREENHSEHTSAVQLVALDPPANGRPDDFRGAVGRLAVTAHLDATRARVGDPLTFTMSVTGTANVTLLPRPDIRLPWADVVTSDERVTLDSNAVLLRGRKEFDWVITPRRSGDFTVPPVRYPYFNPYTERYEVALTPAESLRIAAAPGVVADTTAPDSTPSLSIRRLYRGEEPLPLPAHTSYWVVLALAPFPAIVLASRRRKPAPRAPSRIRALHELAALPAPEPAVLRRAYAAAIAERVAATPVAMSHQTELLRTLRKAGVSDETARDAQELLHQLDVAVFGQGSIVASDAARRAEFLVRAIDREARLRRDLVSVASGLALVFLVALAAHAAGRDAPAQLLFDEGVQQYDARDFPQARSAFFELAQARPNATDAWVNFGSAAWEAHDTAAAVVGWRRAARLSPAADDVRQRLTLTPGFRDGFLGDVPPVPLSLLAAVAGLAWLVAWAFVARAAWRNRPSAVGTWFALAIAFATALAGLKQRELLDGRSSAVVVGSTQLRTDPSLGAEEGAQVANGEVGHVVVRQGVWTRLDLSDGRSGWIESRRLESLGVE